MAITFDTSALLSYYQGKTGQTVTGTFGTGSAPAAKTVPTAPWETTSKAPRATDLVRSVLAGRKFVDVGAAQLDIKGASQDYRKLFALFQGLNALNGLAERAGTNGVSQFETKSLKASFAKGMSEVQAFMDTLKLDKLQLSRGATAISSQTQVGVPRDNASYVTPTLHVGATDGVVEAFQGDVKFDISIKRVNTTFPISVDLADMGSTPRTMGNVVNFLNSKLSAAGLSTRFAVERTPAPPRTVEAGGKTITLAGAGLDSFALKIKGDLTETLTLSAPSTSGAVYLAQVAGKDTTQRQLLKFQTDTSGTTTPAPAAYAAPGEAFTAADRVFARNFGPEVANVRSTATGPDGSLYVLADVTSASDGQAIKGDQDVALLKYDSAGALIYSRTLGAAETASGMALSVSADGKVAIAGSVTGALNFAPATGSTTSAMITGDDAAKTDSFVTVFNADGEELWTQRRAARDEDEATSVAFGADGSVYVAGRARSAMAGTSTALGGWDNYLQGFTAAGAARFTTQFGTALDDKPGGLVVDGSSVVVGAVENGHGILRRFDIPVSGAPTLAATRDLGDLQGGTIAGLALNGGELVVAGSTRNGALSAGTVTAAYTAGIDAFAARLSAGLGAAGTDRLAYYGGAGDSAATAVTVSGGQVWIAGTADGALPGMAKIGDKDSFLTRIDLDTGAATWARRFTGSEKQAAPTSIAVDPAGASVLDRLGLPTGTIDATGSQKITAVTSVRPGDQFFISAGEGVKGKAVTIEADDTLKTLAAKIGRASGFRVSVKVVKFGDFDRLEIKSLNARSPVEITAGKGGRDALEALGLAEGAVRTLPTGADADDYEKVYGLKLASDLDLDTPAAIKKASENLLAAMAVIRSAYRDLKTASEPKSAASAAINGPVPAYLSNQISNYQAALDRLTGGY